MDCLDHHKTTVLCYYDMVSPVLLAMNNISVHACGHDSTVIKMQQFIGTFREYDTKILSAQLGCFKV